ncbi:MAG: transcription termination factor Rho [Desulfosarcina sp.]|nr:transcription termination factor Rho [Desulfosarcina sp.]MBC2742762.1 transcription termination factor Rho [Desulfosarcina sp.]MBC2765672.1 transcription termination factor Rho [Desulfosarcina sp.]
MTKGTEGAEKPLDKMTVKELREIALSIPDIKGVHGMNKQDLLDTVKTHRGIKEEKPRKANRSVREIKKQIRALKAKKREDAGNNDRKQSDTLRRQISRLKKKTRRAA